MRVGLRLDVCINKGATNALRTYTINDRWKEKGMGGVAMRQTTYAKKRQNVSYV